MTTITGVVNITEGSSPDFMSPPGPPHTYLGVAFGMVNAVRVLADASPTSHMALCLVASHVLECALKAYLSRSGSDATVRAPAVRHNLLELWSMAHADGLPISNTAPDWVDTLSHLHNKPFYLRYSTGVHGLVMPGAEPMASELPQLLALVHQQLTEA